MKSNFISGNIKRFVYLEIPLLLNICLSKDNFTQKYSFKNLHFESLKAYTVLLPRSLWWIDSKAAPVIPVSYVGLSRNLLLNNML